jgi:tetratricopeptide (TPR) repeat protein
VILAPARPELFEGRPAWAASARNAAHLDLSPLSEDETSILIARLLGRTVVPADVLELILQRADGSPLFAEEYVRLLKDRGIIRAEGPTWRLDPHATIPLPAGIHALIAARLDTIGRDQKSMLANAAVLGSVFWSGAVASMVGTERSAVDRAMGELVRGDLVRRSRSSSLEGETEYRFWHGLVRDVAYRQLPKAVRANGHLAAAAWIERATGDRVGDHAEILAHHFTTALNLTRSTGQEAEARDIEGPAIRFLTLAGERALGLDVSKAVAFLTQALDLAPPGQPQRAAVLVRWADAARQTGRHADAATALEEAIDAFHEEGNSHDQARAMTFLAGVQAFMGDPERGSVVDRAVTMLEAEGPGPDLVEAYTEQAFQEELRGDYGRSIRSAEQAIGLAADLGLETPARAVGWRGVARSHLGDVDCVDDLRRALSIALEQGRGREAAIMYNALAVAELLTASAAPALAIHREGMTFCEERGLTELGLAMEANSLDPLFMLGRWDEVLRTARALGERFRASGSTLDMVQARISEARVLVWRGHPEEALPPAEECSTAARDADAADYIVFSFAVTAEARLAAGDARGARALLGELEASSHARQSQNYPTYIPEMVRTAVAADDLELASRIAEGFEPTYPLHLLGLSVARAALAEARGEVASAAALYRDARERSEQLGIVPERASAMLGEGRCLLALGDPRAEPILVEGGRVFASMGARPAVAEVDSLLQRAAALSS